MLLALVGIYPCWIKIIHYTADTMKTIGEKIRDRRKDKGLTQKRLAALLKIQYQSVQDWERGRTKPATGKIQRLCEILDINPAVLLLEEKDGLPCENVMSVKEPTSTLYRRREGKRCMDLFEKLRPKNREIMIKLMEGLILKDKKDKLR